MGSAQQRYAKPLAAVHVAGEGSACNGIPAPIRATGMRYSALYSPHMFSPPGQQVRLDVELAYEVGLVEQVEGQRGQRVVLRGRGKGQETRV